jgi:Domain of Unknown Function (DUF326)
LSHTAAMLRTTSSSSRYDADTLARCIDSCFDCAQSCTACADACLAEETVGHLRHCISLNLNCADVCATTGFVLSRQLRSDDPAVPALIEACVRACASCAEECERHAEMHEHCRLCAEVCRECEERCRELLG